MDRWAVYAGSSFHRIEIASTDSPASVVQPPRQTGQMHDQGMSGRPAAGWEYRGDLSSPHKEHQILHQRPPKKPVLPDGKVHGSGWNVLKPTPK